MGKVNELYYSMKKAGVYSPADIERICKLEYDFQTECEEIAKQCAEEGYPSHGENYDLRCAAARVPYDEQIELIDAAY